MADLIQAQRYAKKAIFKLLHGRREEIEDVLQDAVVKALRFSHQFRGDSAFNTWFTRIAITTALMRLRSQKSVKVTDIDQIEVKEDRPGPYDMAWERYRAAVLHAEIAKLPLAQREEACLELAGNRPGDSTRRKSRAFNMRNTLRERLGRIR